MRAHPHKIGLVFGLVFGGVHAAWSLIVALGWGQPIFDFILWAHMINLPFIIGPFDLTASATLIVLTALVGYVVGRVVGIVWNKIH